MANFDMSAANGLLKELYFGQEPPNVVYEDRPFLAMVKKMEQAVGEYVPVPLRWANSQGRSSQFNLALQNQTALKASKFLVTLVKDYSLATIDNQTLRAMSTDKGSFARGVTTVVDSAMGAISNSLSSAIFRSGTGSVSQINNASAFSGAAGVITLQDPNDIVQFEVGQTLQAAATDGATPRAALGYVISRSVQNGTVTVSATAQGGPAGSPSGWAIGDFLLVQGDSNAKITGLSGWIPASDPTAGDNFFGVDRSVDPGRLAGIRPSGTASQSITEALYDSATLVSREGGSPKFCVMPFSSFAALQKELGTKVVYTDPKGPAEIAFRGISIHGPKGVIEVFPDKDCPSKTAFLLQLDTWKLYSLDKAPGILTYLDGNEFLRVNNQDAAEVRIGYYANLGCDAPGFNARIALAA